MITGDHGSHFIASRMCTRCFFSATRRCNDELVGGKDQFRWEAIACLRDCFVQEPTATFSFRGNCLGWTQNFYNFPFFGGTDERNAIVVTEIDLKESRAPQFAFVSIAATLFRPINDLM